MLLFSESSPTLYRPAGSRGCSASRPDAALIADWTFDVTSVAPGVVHGVVGDVLHVGVAQMGRVRFLLVDEDEQQLVASNCRIK